MLQTKLVEKIKTHFKFDSFLSGYRTVFEIMCKNMEQPDRP